MAYEEEIPMPDKQCEKCGRWIHTDSPNYDHEGRGDVDEDGKHLCTPINLGG